MGDGPTLPYRRTSNRPPSRQQPDPRRVHLLAEGGHVGLIEAVEVLQHLGRLVLGLAQVLQLRGGRGRPGGGDIALGMQTSSGCSHRCAARCPRCRRAGTQSRRSKLRQPLLELAGRLGQRVLLLRGPRGPPFGPRPSPGPSGPPRVAPPGWPRRRGSSQAVDRLGEHVLEGAEPFSRAASRFCQSSAVFGTRGSGSTRTVPFSSRSPYFTVTV